MLGSQPPRWIKLACALLTLTGLVLSTSGCGTVARSPVIEILQGSADDIIRQGDSAAAATKKVEDAIENLRSSRSAALEDAARARTAMQQDPDAAAALSTVCGIAFDVATGELPDGAEEWFDYAGDLAAQLQEGGALAADAQEVAELIMDWRRGEVEGAQLQLATLAFEQIYC